MYSYTDFSGEKLYGQLVPTCLHPSVLYRLSDLCHCAITTATTVPDIFAENLFKRYDPLFFLGPARSGAPYHIHSLAANILIYGR